MHDRPHGADLLEVARWSLLEEVAPTLKGRQRYIALMVANALVVAAREINEVDRSERAWRAVLGQVMRQGSSRAEASLDQLVQSIRAGRHDGDATLYNALVETADVAASIWKPGKSG